MDGNESLRISGEYLEWALDELHKGTTPTTLLRLAAIDFGSGLITEYPDDPTFLAVFDEEGGVVLTLKKETIERACAILYTDAPTSYDGFGAITLEAVGARHERLVRKVAIPHEHAEWFVGRVRSGLYMAITPDKWMQLKDMLLDKEGQDE